MEPQTEHRKPGRPPGPRKESFVVEGLTEEQIAAARELVQNPFAIEIYRGKHSLPEVVAMMADVLSAIRVRSVGGYRRDRCAACDHPHPISRPCACPHHAAAAYLRSVGVEVPDL
jgi:hypothetical protein